MKREVMNVAVEKMLAGVKSYVERAFAPVQERIVLLAKQRESADQLLADLEERVCKLERERLRASE